MQVSLFTALITLAISAYAAPSGGGIPAAANFPSGGLDIPSLSRGYDIPAPSGGFDLPSLSRGYDIPAPSDGYGIPSPSRGFSISIPLGSPSPCPSSVFTTV